MSALLAIKLEVSARVSELISMSEFARRKGVTPQSVHKAIKSNRLGVVHDKGRPKLDWEIASAQWDRSAVMKKEARKLRVAPAQVPEPDDPDTEAMLEEVDEDDPAIPSGTDYFEQRGATEAYKAKLARLKYLEEKGQLVRSEDVKYGCSQMVASIKQKVQSIPSKAKIRLPHLSIADMSVLDDLVRESLTELAEWSLKDG